MVLLLGAQCFRPFSRSESIGRTDCKWRSGSRWRALLMLETKSSSEITRTDQSSLLIGKLCLDGFGFFPFSNLYVLGRMNTLQIFKFRKIVAKFLSFRPRTILLVIQRRSREEDSISECAFPANGFLLCRFYMHSSLTRRSTPFASLSGAALGVLSTMLLNYTRRNK
ncbi:hypothetical protein FNL37_2536 [Methylovorus glucosotrophus]|nr:hypothetical protein FNL37_2536 [Methylovorus glucosotrophus]